MEQKGTKTDRLALALAEGDTVSTAAGKAGIGRTTAYRRLADPAFRQRIQTLRGEMIGRALGRMAVAHDRLWSDAQRIAQQISNLTDRS